MNVFLPCRLGSQRIPNKNIIQFATEKGGLLSIKLQQLVQCTSIDSIVLSSNDERVLEFATNLKNSKIVVDERPMHLGSSETSTDDLIAYVSEIMPEDDILWTHVTSPFIDMTDYENCIKSYYQNLENGFDSLMTAKKLQGFIWKQGRAISYDKNQEKWPRTQTIEPMFEIDSGIFINPIESYRAHKDRIGLKPFIQVLDSIKSLDIDWPEDFELAQYIWECKNEC